ncbi:thiamine phosphate synthase [Siminovitchia sediminis]|uniref:Thiamine-phosphate synthase n=1 Tax=Siminovitchia sediminis TaxID=1274353 RepID=A0ABW4KH36_9BACI
MKYNNKHQLYLVTEEDMPLQQLMTIIKDAAAGGAGIVQLREKNLDSKSFYEKALSLKKFLDELSIPLVINDRADIALAVGANGIHLGQSDLPLDVVKQIVPDSMMIGISAHNEEEAVLAEEKGADYIGVGSVFPTSSKADADRLPEGMLARIIDAVSIPVVAIGGIHIENSGQLQEYDLDGIAVISAITRAENPKWAAQQLLKNAFGAVNVQQ